MNTIVMKFGGSSVEDAPAFQRVASIVRAHEDQSPVVVISAMGRVTGALLSSVQLAQEGDTKAAMRCVEEHLARHARVAQGLGATARADIASLIESARREINESLHMVSAAAGAGRARLQDSIVSHGERLCGGLLTAVLCECGVAARYVDARRCIVTDEEYGNARPVIDETMRRTQHELGPLLQARVVPVLGGFIASSAKGETTTLGRGSSDYTAALVGAALDASEIQIWTDVSGVLTADPQVVGAARTVTHLSYEEATMLARFGARVLHPMTIQPVIEKSIPVRVLNSRAREEKGTHICASVENAPGIIKAIAHKTGVTIIEVASTPLAVANGFLHAISAVFERSRTSFQVMAVSEASVSLWLDETNILPGIVRELQEIGSVKVKEERALICLVGDGLGCAPGTATEVSGILRKTHPPLGSPETNGGHLLFVVAQECAGELVLQLHQALFQSGAAYR